MRCIDSLQLTDREKVATPQGWQPGDKLIVHNSLKTEDAKKHFEGKEVEEVFVRLAPLFVLVHRPSSRSSSPSRPTERAPSRHWVEGPVRSRSLPLGDLSSPFRILSTC